MRQTPFTVNVAVLLQNPGSRRPARRTGPIGGLTVTGSAVPEGAEVVVDIVLEAVPEAVIARGTVEAPWRGECRRCLAEAAGAVRAHVREVFEEEHDPDQTYPLVGDQLDLEPLARDAVLLELPQVPLCREGCQGLCSICGADLNAVTCACSPEVGDPRWAALDVLRET